MLANRLPGVLPMLDSEQALEVTAVHSVAGTSDEDTPLITRPPFVDPNDPASLAAVVGGGLAHIRPGSISLADRGVRFLDESHDLKHALRHPHRCSSSANSYRRSRQAGRFAGLDSARGWMPPSPRNEASM